MCVVKLLQISFQSPPPPTATFFLQIVISTFRQYSKSSLECLLVPETMHS